MRFNRLVIAVLLSAVVIVPGHAQIKASSVPISRDTVILRLLVGQTPAKLAVQNGGLARVAIKNGPVLGLIPTMGTRGVDLVVMEIVADPLTGNEGMRQLTKVSLSVGNVTHLDTLPIPLKIELLQTAAARPPTTDTGDPCTKCCVTCGTTTVCACWVELECGRCCCSSTCECPWIDTSGTCTTGGGATTAPTPRQREVTPQRR